MSRRFCTSPLRRWRIIAEVLQNSSRFWLANLKEAFTMWRILLTALLVAGCAQLPPAPEDMQAKKFEPAGNRSVIYISRQLLDSPEGGVLTLDERSTITTYQ